MYYLRKKNIFISRFLYYMMGGMCWKDVIMKCDFILSVIVKPHVIFILFFLLGFCYKHLWWTTISYMVFLYFVRICTSKRGSTCGLPFIFIFFLHFLFDFYPLLSIYLLDHFHSFFLFLKKKRKRKLSLSDHYYREKNY